MGRRGRHDTGRDLTHGGPVSELDSADLFRRLARRSLGVSLSEDHGVPDWELDAAETRLGCAIPDSLRGYYGVAGRFAPFTEAHNYVLAPNQLTVEGPYLVFMEENQEVVSWGIALSDLGEADPTVWQRVNTEPATWYSEEKPFSRLMVDMYEWYVEIGVWKDLEGP